MLRVYKDETWSKAEDAEKFFDANLPRFDLTGDMYESVLYRFGRCRYLGNGKVETPYGKALLHEIPTPAKLALCLIQYPSMMFDGRSAPMDCLRDILTLPDGNIYLDRTVQIPYYFPVKILTPEREILRNSTELMVYLQRG